MGQYHYVCNYTKHEYINPHGFNDGLKLMEFGVSRHGTLQGLAVLLAASCKGKARGGGDIHPWTGGPGYEGRVVQGLTEERGQWLMDNIVGRWAGDQIAIIGDYAEDTDAGGLVGHIGSPWVDPNPNMAVWRDITPDVFEAINMDYYTWKANQPEGE